MRAGPEDLDADGGLEATVDPGAHGITKSNDAYGNDRGNLAYRSTTDLVDGFTTILAGCRQVLRPGGVVVVTVRPFRHKGALIDLPSAVVGAGIAAGLTPVAWMPASLGAIRDNRIIARPSFFQLSAVRKARAAGTPLHLIAHEDVLVFTKPLRVGSVMSALHPLTTPQGNGIT